MHPSKRRRLDNTQSVLTKPFRSPVKIGTRPSQTVATNPSQPDLVDAASHSSSLSLSATHSPTSPAEPSPGATIEPEALKKEYIALSKQLKDLRQTLDTAQQAHNIERTGQEHKMETLVDKWKAVAREAAEELFETFRQRATYEGGIDTWIRDATTYQSFWTDEGERDISTKSPDLLAQQKANDDELVPHDDLLDQACSVNKQKHQPRTMDLMLQQMNIDPNLLDFDNTSQQWKDS